MKLLIVHYYLDKKINFFEKNNFRKIEPEHFCVAVIEGNQAPETGVRKVLGQKRCF